MDMTENPRAVIGANNPPDPIEEITAQHEGIREEAEQWADGTLVETEGQMLAVDVLIKAMKAARKDIDTARDGATKPLHEAWKGEIARWKPTQDDYDRIIACLVAAQNPYKQRLAAEKEAARQEAERLAWEKNRAAQEAIAAASATDIEAQRDAAKAMADADAAKAAASAATKDTVKGMRTVTKYEVTDHRALLNWIAKNARDDVTAFIDEWARRNHKDNQAAEGLRVWAEREAY